MNLTAEGFDPHEDFGWPRPEHSGFDLVTSMFVLNVLPDPWQRIQALTDAASFARPSGHVVVVTRSPEEITKAAADGALAESFNATFKRETLQGRKSWPTERETRLDAFRWLHRYNTRRRHSRLGQRSPIAFENALHHTPTTLAPAA